MAIVYIPPYGSLTFSPYAGAYCPKCGHQAVWRADRDIEDNAGDYCVCTDCFHDWHMYGLDGYEGTEKTQEIVRQITAFNL